MESDGGQEGGTSLEDVSHLVIEPSVEMLRLVLSFAVSCDRDRLEARLGRAKQLAALTQEGCHHGIAGGGPLGAGEDLVLGAVRDRWKLARLRRRDQLVALRVAQKARHLVDRQSIVQRDEVGVARQCEISLLYGDRRLAQQIGERVRKKGSRNNRGAATEPQQRPRSRGAGRSRAAHL